jgi:phytoene/squalene synthetase
MREAVELARDFFYRGLPLVRRVDRRLAVDIELFSRGGLRVLERIEKLDYNVLRARPVISRTERLGLFLSTLARQAFRRAA